MTNENESTESKNAADGDASALSNLVSWLLVRLKWFFSRQESVRITACEAGFEGKNGVYYQGNIRYVYKDCTFKSAN